MKYSTPDFIFGSKAQSAIEYLMTYGWMLLVVAIAGGTVFSVVQSSGDIESVSGLSNTDVRVGDFGSNNQGIQLELTSGAAESIEISKLIIRDDQRGLKADVNPELNIPVGEKDIAQLIGVQDSESSKTYDLEIRYSSGGLSNLSVEGEITGKFQIFNGTVNNCKEYKQINPQAESGKYDIDTDLDDKKETVYCNFSPQNSESNYVSSTYTFKYVEDAVETNSRSDSNTCKENGLMLFSPRSPSEYRIGANYVIDEVGKSPGSWDTNQPMGGMGPLGVYISINGESNGGPANFDSEEERDLTSSEWHIQNDSLGEDNLYGEGTDGWQNTLPGDRPWYIENNEADQGEPNGDYTAGDWLGMQWYGSTGNVTNYNDLSNGYTYDTYLCAAPTSLGVDQPNLIENNHTYIMD